MPKVREPAHILYGRFLLSCESVRWFLSASRSLQRLIPITVEQYLVMTPQSNVKVPLAVSATLYRTLCREPYCRRPDIARKQEAHCVPFTPPTSTPTASTRATVMQLRHCAVLCLAAAHAWPGVSVDATALDPKSLHTVFCAECTTAWSECRSGSRHPRREAGPLGAQPLPRVLERAASKAADSTAFDHAGTTYFDWKSAGVFHSLHVC